MRIRLRIGESVHTATLAEGAAARDFASLLPLTLALRDYNSTEKIADLPRRLEVAGAPDGYDPSPGDITYYAPWGNLAIFYRDFGYSRGLVHLGTVNAPAEALRTPGRLEVTIERGRSAEHETEPRMRRRHGRGGLAGGPRGGRRRGEPARPRCSSTFVET